MAILKPGETYDFDKEYKALRKKRLEKQRFPQTSQPAITFPNMEQRIANPQPVSTNRPTTSTAGRVSTTTPTRTFTPLGQASRLGVEPSAIPENYLTSQNKEYSTSLDRQNRYGGGNLPGQQARIGATLQDEEVYNRAVDELMRQRMQQYNEKWGDRTVNNTTIPTGQLNRLGVEQTTPKTVSRDRQYDDNFIGQAQANYYRGRLSQDEAAAYSRYVNDPTDANKAYAENIKSLNQGFTEKNANLFDAVGPDGRPLGEVNNLLSQTGAGYLPQFYDQMKAGIGGAIAGGAAGSVVPVLGTAAGAKAGYVAGTGVYSYNQMQGAAYSSLIDAGIDEQTAMRAASDEALVSSLIEMADAGFDLAMLGGGKLINSIAGQGIKQTAKVLAKDGSYEIAESGLKKFAKALSKYGLNVGQEYLEEYTQETVSMANIDRVKSGNQGGGALGLAGDTASKLFNMTPEEKAQAHAAGMEGLKIAALRGGASAAVNYSVANGIDTSRAKEYGKAMKETGNVNDIVSEGLASPNDSVSFDLASKLSEKIKRGETPSDADVGKLYIANVKIVSTEKVEAEPVASEPETLNIPSKWQNRVLTSPSPIIETPRPTTQAQPFTNDFEALGKAGMDVIDKFYDPNIDRATYYADFARVYTAAKNGQDVSTVDLGVIDENTAKAIYVAQEADAVSSTQQKYFGKNSGLVRNQTLAKARIPSSAKRTLDTLAKTIGVKIELVDSITDADGHEANASISDGVIRVAMNSEQPLFTATVHEAVHRIKSADTESYNQLRALVYKALQDDNSKQFAKSLKSRGKRYDTLNQDTVSEELVADAIGYALGDEKTLREVLGDNRNLIQKVYDAISEIIASVRRALGNKSLKLSKEQRAEFAALEKNLSELQRTVKTALGNVKEVADKKTITKPTETKYSLKDSEGRQLTDAQAEFFKDSKVRDKDGNLLVVYHGTGADFTEFDKAKSGGNYEGWGRVGDGIYFTPSKNDAKHWAENSRGNTSKVMECYLDIKNPFNVMEEVSIDISSLSKKHGLSDYESSYIKRAGYRLVDFLNEKGESVSQFLASYGFDGIVDSYAMERAVDLVVFAPSQIKAIDNASPTENADIRYSLKDSDGRQLTDAQAEFFKDSKVRDKDGNLLRLYHGTSSDFTVFDKNKIGSTGAFEGTGFNFTTSEARATGYAYTGKGSPNVFDGYVNVTNPLSNDKVTLKTRELANLIAEIDPTGDNLISDYAKNTRDYGTETFVKREALTTARAMTQYYDNDVDIYSGLSAGAGGYVGLMDAFMAMGYDGLIHYNQDGNIQTVVTFDSNQFKNFDNANPTSNPDIRYSLKQMDKDYLAAAEDGDTETAQRMVDEAAKKAGYKLKVYHGTSGDFTVFDTDEQSTTRPVHAWNAEYPDGTIFAANDKSAASYYGSKVMTLYLKPFELKTFKAPDGYSAARAMDDKYAFEVYNYPVVAVKSKDITIYATLYNTLLKSADPITRDDEGNVIPLSERFNPDSEDIRFSRKGIDDDLDEFGQVEERKEKLEAQIDPNKIPKDFRNSIRDLAKKLFDEYGSTLGVQKGTKAIANDLYYLFDYIATQNSEGKPLTFNEMYDKAVLVARNIIENSATLNDEKYNSVKDVVDYIRNTKILVTKDATVNITDYEAFRKRNFGVIKLSSKGGLPIEKVWNNVVEMAPGLFDGTTFTDAAAQLEEMARFAKENKPFSDNAYSYDIDNAEQLLASDIVEAFGGLPKQVEENKANAKVRAKERIDAKMLIERERAKRQAAVKDLVLTYGAIKRGEKAVRDVQVPKQTGPNKRVRQFARTAMESGVVTDKFAEVLEQAVVDGVFSYDPTTDRVANDYALSTIQYRGIEKATAIWDDVVAGTLPATKEQIALGQMLAAEAIKKKDYAAAQMLIAEIAAEGTRAGQIVQAMRLLKKMSGPAQMYYVDKVVDNLQKDLNKRFKRDTVKIAKVRREIKSLEEQAVTAEQTADVAAQKVEALKELKKAVEEFDAAEAELAAQQKSVEDTKKQIAKYHSGKAAATKQTAEIAKKVADLETKLSEAEAALAEARKRRDDMAAQRSELMEQLKSTLGEIDKANRREYSDWWNAQLLVKEIGKAQEELKAAQAKADKAKSLKQQIAALKQQLKQFEQIEIPDELRDALVGATSQEEIDAAVDAILDNVAAQVPSTWFDKWNAWRYLAMLGNPRTHIRNLFGNAIFVPMVTMKNIMAAGIEAVWQPEVRTKSLAGSLPGTGGKYRDFAITDYAEVEEFLHMGGKMNPSDIIRDRQRMFSWSTLEWLRTQNFKLLEKEDNFFLKHHYTRAMTQYLSSNNIDLETMDGKTLQAARDYAIKEAQKATYRDASAFANTLNKMSKKNTALGIIIEGIMPFKKTPVNILKRGMEYSPLGILDTVTRQAKKLKSKDITERISVNEFIDRLASGLTGTGVMALGMYLASQGLLTASMGKDKEDEYEELLGEQEYSIVLGDTRYSIDWMMPVALPLFLGAEINNSNQEEYSAAKVLDAAALIAEPLFNLSMLNGLNNTIKAAQYEDNPMFGVSREVLFNYFGQSIPTLAGQVARTIDDTRRTTYTDKNSPIPTALQYPLQRNLNKIPIVSENSLPYIDAWGRTEKTGKNMASRAVQNMLSPGYVSTYGMSKMEKELKRLAKAADDTGVLPANAPKKFSLNGEDYNLTADQYEKYATKRGKTAHDLLTNLIDKQTLYGYSKLSNTEKAAYVKRVYDYANALAKMQVSKYEPDGWIKQAIEGEKLGIKPLTVIQFYSTSDANGNNYRSKEEKEQAVKAIKNLTKEQREFLLGE